MNAIEDALDLVVQKQEFVEEAYISVTELLEICKRLRDDLSKLSGMLLMGLWSTHIVSLPHGREDPVGASECQPVRKCRILFR